MNDKNDKKPTSKRVLWTRILCGILALLMVGSIAVMAIQLILEETREHDHASAPSYELSETV